jgi:hypothetical protein
MQRRVTFLLAKAIWQIAITVACLLGHLRWTRLSAAVASRKNMLELRIIVAADCSFYRATLSGENEAV